MLLYFALLSSSFAASTAAPAHGPHRLRPTGPDCLAGEVVGEAMTKVEDVLNYAKKGLKDAEGERFIGTAAKFVYEALSMAEDTLEAEAPKVEAAVCSGCRDLDEMFQKVKNNVESCVDKLDNIPVEKVVDGVLNVIDNAFMFACPPQQDHAGKNMLAKDPECLLEHQVTNVFNDLQIALNWAMNELDSDVGASSEGWIGELVKIEYQILRDASHELEKNAPKIESMICTKCSEVAAAVNFVKAEITGFLKLYASKDLDQWASKVLDDLDNALKKECDSPKSGELPATAMSDELEAPVH